MNIKKIIIIILGIFLMVGIFLIVSRGKTRPTDLPSNERSKEGAPVMTEGAKKEMQESSYASGISLKITHPQANATVTNSSLTVKGTTSPNAEVFINDKELKADDSGNFTTTIILDEGENPIIVVANDAEGNSAEEQILVTLQE
jgi:hypothetical protein